MLCLEPDAFEGFTWTQALHMKVALIAVDRNWWGALPLLGWTRVETKMADGETYRPTHVWCRAGRNGEALLLEIRGHSAAGVLDFSYGIGEFSDTPFEAAS